MQHVRRGENTGRILINHLEVVSSHDARDAVSSRAGLFGSARHTHKKKERGETHSLLGCDGGVQARMKCHQ